MKNYMEYKGYRGTISYCGKDRILYGKVLGTKQGLHLLRRRKCL